MYTVKERERKTFCSWSLVILMGFLKSLNFLFWILNTFLKSTTNDQHDDHRTAPHHGMAWRVIFASTFYKKHMKQMFAVAKSFVDRKEQQSNGIIGSAHIEINEICPSPRPAEGKGKRHGLAYASFFGRSISH